MRGRVALIGDAAHGMTPNLGRGAHAAIMDGAVLGGLLSRVTPGEALRRYSRHRILEPQLLRLGSSATLRLATAHRGADLRAALASRVGPARRGPRTG